LSARSDASKVTCFPWISIWILIEMPPSNVEIHQPGWFAIVAIFALLALGKVFGQVFGFAGLLLALPASAVLLVTLRKLHARYLESDLYSGRK